ncbi:protein GIGANTEA-like [Gossypium australe]|uniref:Protein GIGANTEA-like n=1 Tax=Gossypium australe TaxID=47621 RepID=A0A5B6U734_9ROSI|nr:protein GIGANTEA-like [Gossypium australe]
MQMVTKPAAINSLIVYIFCFLTSFVPSVWSLSWPCVLVRRIGNCSLGLPKMTTKVRRCGESTSEL